MVVVEVGGHGVRVELYQDVKNSGVWDMHALAALSGRSLLHCSLHHHLDHDGTLSSSCDFLCSLMENPEPH